MKKQDTLKTTISLSTTEDELGSLHDVLDQIGITRSRFFTEVIRLVNSDNSKRRPKTVIQRAILKRLRRA